MVIMRNNTVLWIFAGLALLLMLSSCSQAQAPLVISTKSPDAKLSETETPGTSTASPTERVDTTPTALAQEPTPTPGGPGTKEPVQPVDIDMPPANFKEFKPADLARADLASRSRVDIGMITVVSTSQPSLEQASCELDLPQEGPRLLLHGERVQVILELKKNLYEYWVFSQEDNLPVAVPCK
jgi:hypothetical protein